MRATTLSSCSIRWPSISVMLLECSDFGRRHEVSIVGVPHSTGDCPTPWMSHVGVTPRKPASMTSRLARGSDRSDSQARMVCGLTPIRPATSPDAHGFGVAGARQASAQRIHVRGLGHDIGVRSHCFLQFLPVFGDFARPFAPSPARKVKFGRQTPANLRAPRDCIFRQSRYASKSSQPVHPERSSPWKTQPHNS